MKTIKILVVLATTIGTMNAGIVNKPTNPYPEVQTNYVMPIQKQGVVKEVEGVQLTAKQKLFIVGATQKAKRLGRTRPIAAKRIYHALVRIQPRTEGAKRILVDELIETLSYLDK